ncbi:protein takeout-like [Musca autumnalis]|uniref:protein takeout-like n=1 Tax=Musca autumnalis TaxID=221902 RepID=UPI003CE698F3
MNSLIGLLIATVLAGTTTIYGAKIIREKPAFFDLCKRSDSGFGQCWSKNVEKLFHEWRSGVPGLKSIGTLDPLHVKRAKISQADQGGPVSLNMEFINAELYGLGETIIEDMGSNGNNLDMKFKITVPLVKLIADYTMQGTILNLPLNGHGKTRMTFKNAVFSLNFHVKLREEGEFTFADLEKVHLIWEDIAGVQFRLDNLFGGNEALEESAHTLFNENWRVLYEILRPSFSQAIQIVFKDIYGKILGILPTSHYLVQ